MSELRPAFDCRMCGTCCLGSGGIVVDSEDLKRLCAHMSLSPQEFSERHAERRNGKLVIRAGDDGRCVFFAVGTGCTVHPAKPNICRAWPFFRGNLVDPESLALAKEYCPGIRRDVAPEEFTRLGLDYLREEGLVGRGSSDEAAALQVEDVVRSFAKR